MYRVLYWVIDLIGDCCGGFVGQAETALKVGVQQINMLGERGRKRTGYVEFIPFKQWTNLRLSII